MQTCTGGDLDIYCPPPEHVCTIHSNSSYHGLVSGGGAEAGNVSIHSMAGAARPGYPSNKRGGCSSGGGRIQGRKKRRRVERENRVGADDGEVII